MEFNDRPDISNISGNINTINTARIIVLTMDNPYGRKPMRRGSINTIENRIAIG